METLEEVEQARAWCVSAQRDIGRLIDALDALLGMEPAPSPGGGLADMARDAGLPRKRYYTLAEVAKASGIPRATLYREAAAGRLATWMPAEAQRGKLVGTAEFDEWMAGAAR